MRWYSSTIIRPISLGTRFGLGFAFGPGFCPPPLPVLFAGVAFTPLLSEVPEVLSSETAAEPGMPFCVVEVGPGPLPVVSDVVTACVDELEVLVFAADADFVSPPLQATAAVAIAIEKRIERFIFRG